MPVLGGGEAKEIFEIQKGSFASGVSSLAEFRSLVSVNPDQVKMVKDQFGRVVLTEVQVTVGEVKSIDDSVHGIYSNSRVERYCSQAQNNVVECATFCVRWTNYERN